MPPDPTIDDEEYESSQDSDFAPEDAAAAAADDGASEASDSEADDGEDAAKKPTKRKRDAGDDETADFENSGDEALIKKAAKKKLKKAARDAAAALALSVEDEGGEGGLVKTRSMRAAEKEERKVAAASGPITVDVDAIWAQMLSGQKASAAPAGENEAAGEADATTAAAAAPDTSKPDESQAGDPSDTIRIKRTYNFAGKVHTEEKVVARSSAEAKLYLASLGKEAAAAEIANAEADNEGGELKRVLKKAFRSAFEPVIEIVSQRSDLNLGMTVRIKAREKEAQAKKLNTVQKSKMDWAGFVDKEGLKDELELAGRAKGSYAERQDFLARSEAKRDDDARRARMAGRVQ
ncbi:bucentaur or craniofacial development-domain-containing protein [Colletotrichum godetiae]|uniref:SWR1-complex protein 5 n=1 Tax=Colletotrichum godetiae TaxID=1209918 RepID=A0AAJ0AZ06_9PEZI|nr:bucentaur or craniofacial development-domain-containing protein [Colletotrichum godetiae]KAK1691460.1 bucentaur or craniofacial development-domain-containing protein [Colletotrichum godetiae]